MPTNLKFHVCRCSVDDIDNLVTFASRLAHKNIVFLPRSKEHFLRKYLSYGEKTGTLNLFAIKREDGDIVGVSGFVPFKGFFGNKIFQGFIGTDAAIDPHYTVRYPGLAAMLAMSYESMVRVEKRFPLIFPNDKKVLKAFRGVRWGEFSRLEEWVNPFAMQLIPDFGTGSIEVSRIEHFESSDQRFFKRVASQYDFLMQADIDLLNWRYFDNPYAAQSIVVAARRQGELAGYMVVQGVGVDICIVDTVIDLEHPSALLLLLFKTLEYFDRTASARILCYMSHQRYIEILSKIGFFRQHILKCLFFKAGLLFSNTSHDLMHAGTSQRYHFNGFAPHLC
ncbi:MAG: hypothetical protein ABH865_03275 [Candidatus Omnitrophota bacterium]|nr:hypothetical protein [Candidatus Omnitrophota bacterium]